MSVTTTTMISCKSVLLKMPLLKIRALSLLKPLLKIKRPLRELSTKHKNLHPEGKQPEGL